ncbi:hypothetical protein GCM10020219_066130 [Nonomuraea dietziae]
MVLATAGDQRLGGGDIDDAIAAWAMEHSGGAGDPMRVKAAAEGAKRELSFSEQATMSLDDGVTLTLDRPTFEALARPVLDKTLAQVEEALRFAAEQKGLDRADVDAVLLVGGSTRIPRVTQMLLEYFDKDEEFVRSDGNPDTLVARGAAIVARKFEPSQEFDLARAEEGGLSDEADELKITLITEHTLGVAVQEGRFDPLISRGAKIPASQKKIYTNPPLAEHIEAAIYQGEGKYVYEDGTTLVGTIHLSDIEPRPEGYHNFEVEFALDINGLLEVRVKHVNTGRDYEATFEQSTSIGQVNELAERRQALLALYSGHDRLTPRQARRPHTRAVVRHPAARRRRRARARPRPGATGVHPAGQARPRPPRQGAGAALPGRGLRGLRLRDQVGRPRACARGARRQAGGSLRCQTMRTWPRRWTRTWSGWACGGPSTPRRTARAATG